MANKPHLPAAVGADERIHFVDFLDQARLGAAYSLTEPGIRFYGFIRRSRSQLKRMIESELAPFDLMILDVRMIPYDGMSLLKSAREHKPDAKVIMLTAYADDKTRNEVLQLGTVAYLSKPFSAFDVLNTVDSALAL